MKTLITILAIFPIIAYAGKVTEYFGTGLEFDLNENGLIDMNHDGNPDFVINSLSNSLDITPLANEGCYLGTTNSPFASLFSLGDFTATPYVSQLWREDTTSVFWDATNGLNSAVVNNTDFYIQTMLLNGFKQGSMCGGYIHIQIDEVNQKLIILDWMYTNHGYYIFGEPNTSSIETSAINIKTFPNPTSDYLQIQDISALNGDIQIINNAGTIVKSISLAQLASLTIDLTDLANGIYILFYEDQLIRFKEKIIKV